MKKYFVRWGDGSMREEKILLSEREMLELVRKIKDDERDSGYPSYLEVFYGVKLELEPVDIVKGWGVKQNSYEGNG